MTKEETDLIITEQNKSRNEILKAVAKFKSDYHELCRLKDMRIAKLENEVAILTNENKILKHDKTNVFAELNDETAKSNEMLMTKVAELEAQNVELIGKVAFLENDLNNAKARIEKMKRYLDCEYCEHYTQPRGCKNCNEEIRSDWKLKEIKEK